MENLPSNAKMIRNRIKKEKTFISWCLYDCLIMQQIRMKVIMQKDVKMPSKALN